MADVREPTGAEASERIAATGSMLQSHETISLAACDAGEPWLAVVYFVEDEPAQGSLDVCCSILMSPQRRTLFESRPHISFVAAGGDPNTWLQGHGTAEIVEDDADAAAITKRLAEKVQAAGTFLERVECTPVRIHVERLKVTDLDADPPVTEFTFA